MRGVAFNRFALNGLDEGAADDGDRAPQTPWAFAARGDPGVEEDVRLLYNGREKTAMDGAVLEMQRARTVLGLDPQAALSHEQAFMACLPPQLVEEMLQWLLAGEAFRVGAAEFVNYLRVECILRYSGAPIDFVERAGFANVTQLQAYRNISSRIRAIKCPVEAMESMQEAARMHWRGTFVHEETSDVDHDATDGLYIFASNATGIVLDATLTTSGSGLSTQVIVDTASRLGAATSSMTMAVQGENVELLQAARFSNRLLLGSSYDVSWLSVVPWSPKFPVQEGEVSPETPFKSDQLTMSRRGRRTCVVAKNEAMQMFASWVRHGDSAEGRVSRYETSKSDLSSVQIVSAQRYGLVVCRDQPSLATSPDGVVALRNDNGTFLATLVVDASAPLGEDAGEGALDVIECECGTPSFREVVEDSGVRARLVHDATVLGVDYALLARASSYGEGQGVGASTISVAPDVSGLENRRLAWVLVRVPETQRAAWKGYFRELQVRFMRFTTEAEPRMPRVAQDGNAVYGNAVELRTVNLWLRLSKLYESDVLEHGTPPACKRLLPLVANVWNRSRSNMDTLLQCTRRHEPAEATVWERLLSLTFYNAFRLHELALSPDGSAVLLYDDRIPATTRFRDFMLSLKNELHTEPFKRFFPLAGPAIV
ncbi:Hypothetical Protein FCC1311_050872 [Hondaea fermentalgiana]|uniref:Uncharacterized protein n=1 Tax=Hondaea fermentalgiana TaxID=2315210 RepID=A0A2R5GD21_9STRA|nr:Hypothetical Protein FCC1311_050872 [Hondaea fermentalgiana]|eukprot:GBG28866.1 Hypothetical Protein FCC1311_050872 [Hondaea fermentalgiana]